MNRFILISSVCFWWTTVSVAGTEPNLFPTVTNTEKSPLPSGPIIGHMPSYATWRIQYTYTTDKPLKKVDSVDESKLDRDRMSEAATSRPRSVNVVRTHPIYHVLMTDTLGRDTDIWCDGSKSYVSNPGLKSPHLPGSGAGGASEIPAFLDYSHSDFPDLGWVSAGTYIGTVRDVSASYLVFQRAESGITVWIDVDSHLPARWQSATETRTYIYADPPTELLALPDPVIKAAKDVFRLNQIDNHRPLRGS